jgi:hypothetical protein
MSVIGDAMRRVVHAGSSFIPAGPTVGSWADLATHTR